MPPPAVGRTGFVSDLVLNDFVAGALVNKEISILSDGTPQRPMINTKDMARAFEWGVVRTVAQGGNFVAVNTGSNEWNNQIAPLAEAVALQIPGVKVSVNPDAAPDKRSYRVNFDLYKSIAPDHQPVWNLQGHHQGDQRQPGGHGFQHDPRFRESRLIRLRVLNFLQENKLINEKLEWV
ncbi:MAG: hypothetical protein R2751_16015 [Bacteroidales bacterium]